MNLAQLFVASFMIAFLLLCLYGYRRYRRRKRLWVLVDRVRQLDEAMKFWPYRGHEERADLVAEIRRLLELDPGLCVCGLEDEEGLTQRHLRELRRYQDGQ